MPEEKAPRGVPGGAAPRPGELEGSGLPSTLPLTRFAPSPTGLLHLGHAFSALTAAARGRFLLRLEDIDHSRCRPEFEAAIFEDLHWLGLDWPAPVMRQSDRQAAYSHAIARLDALGLTYPCRCTRGDIRAAQAAPQEGATGADGAVYPGICRTRAMSDAGPRDAIRLDMSKALTLLPALDFEETGTRPGRHPVNLARLVDGVGDVVLARPGMGTSYHLAVVIDDAAQHIDEVVRGEDLFEATAIHRVLQSLLGLPTPRYHHHQLIRDETGRRLAKRDDARSLRHYREGGTTPAAIRNILGF